MRESLEPETFAPARPTAGALAARVVLLAGAGAVLWRLASLAGDPWLAVAPGSFAGTGAAALAAVELSGDAAWYLARGQAVQVPSAPAAGMLRLYDDGGCFLGVGEVLRDGRVAPRRLLRRQAPETQRDSLPPPG